MAMPTPETIGISTAAQIVGISERHLKRILAKGEGPPSVRLGRRRLFMPETLRAWLKSREGKH